MASNQPLKERPIDRMELIDLMLNDEQMATVQISGKFLIRSAEQRREFEIRAAALKFMLENSNWIDPTK
jgi:hypothetical protein